MVDRAAAHRRAMGKVGLSTRSVWDAGEAEELIRDPLERGREHGSVAGRREASDQGKEHGGHDQPTTEARLRALGGRPGAAGRA